MLKEITSRDNKAVKLARSLHKKHGRDKSGMYFAEGVRLLEDAIKYSADKIEYLLASKEFYEKNRDFINFLDKSNKIVYITEDKIFNEVCGTESPQGIAGVMRIPEMKIPDFSAMNYLLLLDRVSEPGNMGTIIRTAEASGIDCICLLNNCTDVYSPKVVRSAMGSLFRMPICKLTNSQIELLKKDGFTVLATALYNSMPIEQAKPVGKRAIVIGNEAHGVSKEVLELSDMAVRIDMQGNAESLNAGVASGIAMYILRP